MANWKLTAFTVVLSLSAATICGAQSGKNWKTNPNATQADLNAGAHGDYKQADARLNQLYQKALKRKADDKVFIQKFRKAQQAWIAFRDAHMDSRFPSADKSDYGSIYQMCYWLDMTELTNARCKQLEKWANGIPEGSGCSGSYPVNAD